MSEINEYLSNSTESRGEKHVILKLSEFFGQRALKKKAQNGNRNNFAEEKKAHRK